MTEHEVDEMHGPSDEHAGDAATRANGRRRPAPGRVTELRRRTVPPALALAGAMALGCAASGSTAATSVATSCELDSDCPEGVCLSTGPSGAGLCSAYCSTDADCPGGWQCGSFGGVEQPVCRCDGPPGSCDGETTASCPRTLASPWSGGGCAASTRECMRSCASSACARACLDDDPDPEGCRGCVDRSLVIAANENGCQGRYDCLAACYADGCPERGCSDACAAEEDAWLECAAALSSSARAEAIAGCFP